MKQMTDLLIFIGTAQVCAEAHASAIHPVLDDLLQTLEGSAADEQDIRGVNLNQFLMGVLSAALGRYGSDGSLQNLQQCLLYTLAGYIPGNRRVLRLSGDLIDLVDVDNAVLRTFNIVIRCLNDLQQNVLHILAHIAGLCQ